MKMAARLTSGMVKFIEDFNKEKNLADKKFLEDARTMIASPLAQEKETFTGNVKAFVKDAKELFGDSLTKFRSRIINTLNAVFPDLLSTTESVDL